MQLSKKMLTRIIKEELANVLAEQAEGPVDAVLKKNWAKLSGFAAQSAEEGFPESQDMSRKEILARRFLRQLSLEIEDGGEKTLNSFAAYLKKNPRIEEEIGVLWSKILNTKPRDDL